MQRDVVQQLLDYVEKRYRKNPAKVYRNSLILLLLADAGLSCREVAQLSVTDIEEGFITAGSGRKRRKIPMTFRLKGVLERYMPLLGNGSSGPLLPGRKGRLSARGVQSIVSRLAAGAGVKVTAKDLTESFVRKMVERGVRPEVIATLGGFSRLDALRRFSDGVDFDDLCKAVRLLETTAG
ncbi:MAG: tyrosine-type recombinase/integrase [Desulfotomaculales bacterium]